MFAVIFEVKPWADRWDDYLELAKQLRPKLEAIDGFIDNERFSGKQTEGLVLSLSIWRDAKSVVRWRTQGEHHGVQEQGRSVVFEDYHLRVGEIAADTAPPKGMTIEQRHLDETEVGAGKICTITETLTADAKDVPRPDAGADGLLSSALFEGITNPGKLLLLATWRDMAAASAWMPAGEVRHRQVRVIRDYGMFDRREAPQFYPDVTRAKPE